MNKNFITVSQYIFSLLQSKLILFSMLLIFGSISVIKSATKVVTLKAPNGGIQPQAVKDEKGNIHMIYYSGAQGGGNLFYVTQLAGKDEFSAPIQVNSVQGSAVSAGTIRGGQIALGKGGRVHVSWNGSNAVKGNMEYARLNDAGTGFEAERGLMFESDQLDGGGTVAADEKGNVYVAWHGTKIGGPRGEDQRLVWIAISKDDGKTFAKEVPVWAKGTGVCGCCQMRAFVDSKGTINIMYRSASDGNRDVYLLFGKEGGKDFVGGLLHPWKISMCPMSTIGISESSELVATTWETDGQIYFSKIRPGVPTSAPIGMPGTAKGRKFSCVAVNNKGELIVVWAEGAGWNKGGDLVWQTFDSKGKPTEDKGRIAGGVPTWGVPTAVATDTGFVVIY